LKLAKIIIIGPYLNNINTMNVYFDRHLNFIVVFTVAPRFLVQPSSVAVAANSDVELECDAYARPRSKISWLKNGDDVIPSDYFQIIDGHNLKILGLVSSDEGLYQCIATNDVAVTHAAAHLVILPKGS